MADEPLVIIGADRTVLAWSAAAEALFGRAAGEVVGRRVDALPADVTVPLRIAAQQRADGSTVWAVFHDEPGGGPLWSAVLEALFTRSPFGLHVMDPELRIVRVNSATDVMRGRSVQSLVGSQFPDVYPFEDPAAEEAVARQVLEQGAPSLARLVRLHIDVGAKPRCFALSVFRLESERGDILGLAVVAADVTTREAQDRRIRILTSVRQHVGRSLDLIDTGQDFSAALVPDLADIAVVEVTDAVMRGDEPEPEPSPEFVTLRRIAHADHTGRLTDPGIGGHDLDVRGRSPFALAVADRRSRLVDLGADPPWLDAGSDAARALRRTRAHSLLVVPLVVRGTLLGLLSLYRCADSPPFETDDDLPVAEEAATHAALCLDNARRFTRERVLATTVQRRLLPPHSGALPGIRTAEAYVPGHRIRGGWYDVIPLPGARTALVVGEVSGEGIHAAAAMGQLRIATRALAALDLAPDELLARLDETARLLRRERQALPADDPLRSQDLTAGCLYVIYDPTTRTCTAAGAGIPTPVLVEPDASPTVVEVPNGPRLGDTDISPFAAVGFSVATGSTLLLATPALVDSVTPDALREVLSDTRAPVRDLCDRVVYESTAGAPRDGDTVVLAARLTPLAPEATAGWELEPVPESAAEARRLTRRRLASWDIPEETGFVTDLIVSELVTNAVRYGAGPIRLRLLREPALTVEVTDHSAAQPQVRHARATDEGGRGLFLIARTADRWGIRPLPGGGKTIWTEQSVEPPTTGP